MDSTRRAHRPDRAREDEPEEAGRMGRRPVSGWNTTCPICEETSPTTRSTESLERWIMGHVREHHGDEPQEIADLERVLLRGGFTSGSEYRTVIRQGPVDDHQREHQE